MNTWIFAPPGQLGASPSGVHPINGSGNPKRAHIFFAPKTGTLDQMEFRIGFVSGPSAMRVSFQNVDLSTGLPDDTDDQFRVIATPTGGWTTPGLMTDDGTDGGAKRSVTAGDLIAFVWQWDSTESGQVWLDAFSDNGNALMRFPYHATHNGTSWAKGTLESHRPALALKYDDGTYPNIPGFVAVNANQTDTSFGTGSTPDEKGALLTLDADVTVTGGWVRSDRAADADFIIYNSGGSEVLNVDLDADTDGTGGIDTYFACAPTALAAGTYRVVLKPTTASTLTLVTRAAAGAAHLEAFFGGGLGPLTTRTDGGSWSESNDVLPYMGLQIELDGGGGSGGGGGGSFPFVG